ncbi:hypothetical protein BLNAU_17462 [Blattamonas nauphoetae]|uniref:WH2 domain-containing protein n=1 Tax=Blattamonas nauphoetae TaxID=2049346 RepID=A0ABQ9X794_9EUKA|nr:hypothetical protein BLNAU_17462 [Blattamonas nauphoetae]
MAVQLSSVARSLVECLEGNLETLATTPNSGLLSFLRSSAKIPSFVEKKYLQDWATANLMKHGTILKTGTSTMQMGLLIVDLIEYHNKEPSSSTPTSQPKSIPLRTPPSTNPTSNANFNPLIHNASSAVPKQGGFSSARNSIAVMMERGGGGGARPSGFGTRSGMDGGSGIGSGPAKREESREVAIDMTDVTQTNVDYKKPKHLPTQTRHTPKRKSTSSVGMMKPQLRTGVNLKQGLPLGSNSKPTEIETSTPQKPDSKPPPVPSSGVNKVNVLPAPKIGGPRPFGAGTISTFEKKTDTTHQTGGKKEEVKGNEEDKSEDDGGAANQARKGSIFDRFGPNSVQTENEEQKPEEKPKSIQNNPFLRANQNSEAKGEDERRDETKGDVRQTHPLIPSRSPPTGQQSPFNKFGGTVQQKKEEEKKEEAKPTISGGGIKNNPFVTGNLKPGNAIREEKKNDAKEEATTVKPSSLGALPAGAQPSPFAKPVSTHPLPKQEEKKEEPKETSAGDSFKSNPFLKANESASKAAGLQPTPVSKVGGVPLAGLSQKPPTSTGSASSGVNAGQSTSSGVAERIKNLQASSAPQETKAGVSHPSASPASGGSAALVSKVQPAQGRVKAKEHPDYIPWLEKAKVKSVGFLKMDMRSAGLNPDALDDPEMLV